MQLDEVRSRLLSILDVKAPEHALDLVDVRVSLQGNTPLIQVFIDNINEGDNLNEGEDSQDALSLDEICEQTPWISAVIDEIDPFDRAYNLEVSSPGIKRPLRRHKDFLGREGETIKLKKKGTSGRLKYTGVLQAVGSSDIVLLCDNKEETIALDDIDSANTVPTF